MNRRLVGLICVVLVLCFGAAAFGADVNELVDRSVLIFSDQPQTNRQGGTQGGMCVGNVVGDLTIYARPVMYHWALWTVQDQEVNSVVVIWNRANWGSEGNVGYRIFGNPKTWDETTCTWDTYVGAAGSWRNVWDANNRLGYFMKEPLTPPPPALFQSPTGPTDANFAFYADEANAISASVVQNWLDHPGANHGIALIHRGGYATNACLGTQSQEWWGQGPGPHIVFSTRYIPEKAKQAEPLSGSTNQSPCNVVLYWVGGDAAVSRDVYFGTNFGDVNTATRTFDPNGVRKAVAQVDTQYPTVGSMAPLSYDTTYYWRIDEVNGVGTPYKGTVWRFTTTGGKATNPVPRTGATDIAYPLTLSWTRSPLADTVNGHDVYLGTSWNEVNAADTNTAGVYKGEANEPNYQTGTLVPAVTYYWRIDEYNTPGGCDGKHTWKGDIWSFTTLGYGIATQPSPADGSTVPDLRAVVLNWRKGDWVRDINEHEVYFGTDFNEVNDANRTVHPNVTYAVRDTNTYDPRPLEFNTTYYWRVDEVNDPNDPAKVWKGNVWSFIVPGYILVDDFSYADVNALFVNWDNPKDPLYTYPECAFTGTGATITWVAGAMSFAYDNNGEPGVDNYWSTVRRDFGAGGADWTMGNPTEVKVLAFSSQGNTGNSADPLYDRMFVHIEDTLGASWEVNNPDPNTQKRPQLLEWNIDLKPFSDHGVNLSKVRYLYIGFGVWCNWIDALGGTGTVLIDNVRLYPSRCVPVYGPTGDIDEDCAVNYGDVDVMAGAWLATDTNLILSPIQAPQDPCVWYKFNDGGGTVADDASVHDYNGAVGLDDGWQASGGHSGGYLKLNGVNNWVTIPNGAFSQNIGQDFTISTWIKVDRDNYPQASEWEPFMTVSQTANIFTIYLPTPSAPTFEPGPAVHFRFANVPGDMTQDDLAECYGMGESAFTDKWHHYAFVKKGSTDYIAIYHNGQLMCDANDANHIDNLPAPTTVWIGRTTYAMWPGGIDDFRLYDYALSDAEIAHIATDGTGKLYLPLNTPADLYVGDPNVVNFKDFSKLAQDWLKQQYWPTW